jgi:hypothetical protein
MVTAVETVSISNDKSYETLLHSAHILEPVFNVKSIAVKGFLAIFLH